MLTQTSELAIRLLVFLAQQVRAEPISPRHVAEQLGESPTYMAKVTSRLVRANVLRVHRGAMGGVTLGRPPEAITLLAIVEACQGALVGDYCQITDDLASTCAYHQAAAELHDAIWRVLSKWSLAQLVAKAQPSSHIAGKVFCRMYPRQVAATRPAAAVRRVVRRNGPDVRTGGGGQKRPRR